MDALITPIDTDTIFQRHLTFMPPVASGQLHNDFHQKLPLGSLHEVISMIIRIYIVIPDLSDDVINRLCTSVDSLHDRPHCLEEPQPSLRHTSPDPVHTSI